MMLVLDTNVLIAAFISHGVCSELLEHCVINHDVVLSKFILDELKTKLTAKFKFTNRDASSVVSLLKSRCSVVRTQALPSPVSRDPDDDNIIATALSGSCDCIITGDKDLLVLKKTGDILIVSPNSFWEIEEK
ncbi:MAG: putative toxin-antitoxin system toxin component, PIN family [Kiritimatiellae bacterium]|nr:putative toxin-antitoxin system toxin component, PIN family [Kiritimatiellia bacterium]